MFDRYAISSINTHYKQSKHYNQKLDNIFNHSNNRNSSNKNAAARQVLTVAHFEDMMIHFDSMLQSYRSEVNSHKAASLKSNKNNKAHGKMPQNNSKSDRTLVAPARNPNSLLFKKLSLTSILNTVKHYNDNSLNHDNKQVNSFDEVFETSEEVDCYDFYKEQTITETTNPMIETNTVTIINEPRAIDPQPSSLSNDVSLELRHFRSYPAKKEPEPLDNHEPCAIRDVSLYSNLLHKDGVQETFDALSKLTKIYHHACSVLITNDRVTSSEHGSDDDDPDAANHYKSNCIKVHTMNIAKTTRYSGERQKEAWEYRKKNRTKHWCFE